MPTLKGLKHIRAMITMAVLFSVSFCPRGMAAIASSPTTAPTSTGATMAQVFRPRHMGILDGRRQLGGMRCGPIFYDRPPAALIPATNWGTTLSPHPTLFFYVSAEMQRLGTAGELEIVDGQGRSLYRAIGSFPAQGGIVSITLPMAVTLEPGQRYQWSFTILAESEDPDTFLVLRGWIERLSEPALMRAIATATPEERPTLYAEAGIWYEAIASLAELRLVDPENEALQSQWATLLESVDLGAIASKPLLGPLPLSFEDAQVASMFDFNRDNCYGFSQPGSHLALGR